MIAAGMDWKKITEFIGHSDVRTTYNRYGKVVPEDLAPAAAQLDEYLDRGRARLESRRHDPEPHRPADHLAARQCARLRAGVLTGRGEPSQAISCRQWSWLRLQRSAVSWFPASMGQWIDASLSGGKVATEELAPGSS